VQLRTARSTGRTRSGWSSTGKAPGWRAIVGWAAATHKRAKLVLDALQMAPWRRDRDGARARA